MKQEKCRFCGARLSVSFCDLGVSPLSNAFLLSTQLREIEPCYPIHPRLCESCFLVQLPQFQSPKQIFNDYPYFSSYSRSWLSHLKNYTDKIIKRLKLNKKSQVIEIASNDGGLLQYFKARGIPILGIEPAKNIAEVANKKGIPTRVGFFGVNTAREILEEGTGADLLIGNNVLAHVPDLNDFVAGLKILLKPGGRITLEFPHLMQLIARNQFDTIYHEHFSYFSFLTTEKIFSSHLLRIYDVEEIDTHGGSLRLYLCHENDSTAKVSTSISRLKKKELAAGLNRIETYTAFSEKVREARLGFLGFLISLRNEGKTAAAYGAPAKGNTLLNYCGIRSNLLAYTVDQNPYKQGRFLPGSRLPIYSPDKIKKTKPDVLVILPWNLREEIMEQMSFIREWGGKFVVPIPRVEVLA